MFNMAHVSRDEPSMSLLGTKLFNDNQLLSEFSLSIPLNCLSEKSLWSIINALTEDLQAAKSRIAELEENLNGLKVQCSKGQFQDDMTGKCKSCRSMEDSCSKTSLSKTVATSKNNCSEILGKSSTDELLCRFCSSRHQRGKTNCPAWNPILQFLSINFGIINSMFAFS